MYDSTPGYVPGHVWTGTIITSVINTMNFIYDLSMNLQLANLQLQSKYLITLAQRTHDVFSENLISARFLFISLKDYFDHDFYRFTKILVKG